MEFIPYPNQVFLHKQFIVVPSDTMKNQMQRVLIAQLELDLLNSHNTVWALKWIDFKIVLIFFKCFRNTENLTRSLGLVDLFWEIS